MEARARNTFVGAVVLTLLAGVSLFIYWRSNSGEPSEVKQYAIDFKTSSLSGLQQNSAVTLRGIRVGSVDRWTVSPTDIQTIRVVLRISNETPIRENTQANIERNLLTGLATIDLTHGSEDSPAVTLKKGEEFPLIAEGSGGLGSLPNDIPALLAKVSSISARAELVLSDKNIENVSVTLQSLRTLSEALAKDSANKNIVSKLDSLIKTAEESIVQVRESITDTARIVSIETSDLSQRFGTAAQALTNTLEGYQDPRSLITGKASSQAGPGEEKKR